MKRKFLVNLFLVLLLNVIVKPFYIIGIDAEILRQTELSEPGSYGNYFSLLGLTFILNIFLDLGITNFNTRHIAQSPHLLKKYFGGILSLRFLLALGYILLVIISGNILSYSSEQMYLLLILAFNQILASFILYLRSNLAGLLLFKQDSIISVLDRTLLIIICSFLLWGRNTNTPFQIEWFVYAQTFSYLITGIIVSIIVFKKVDKLKIKFNKI